jgi:NAD(P)-dependent dehydrogenase (short-subunit alcohol dehydrogenase family)
MTTDQRNPVALILGAGDAIGSAIAKQFAHSGMTVCMTRRDANKLAPLVDELKGQGHEAHAFTSDARDEDQVVELFRHITTDIGPLGAVVFNIGANVPMSILETSSRKFRKIWEMACFAGFLNGREAAKYMVEQGHGTILFTGATASIRGGSVFAAFASAKHGLRALAQSMARELGPRNIHVGHVVIDAMVDTAWINDNFSDAVEAAGPDGIVNPDNLAKNYVMLHEQPRDSWTFELDARPWSEKW